MKTANIKLIHKKGDHSQKDNYQPVSVLPNLSKVFERCIYNQIAQLFDKTLTLLTPMWFQARSQFSVLANSSS